MNCNGMGNRSGTRALYPCLTLIAPRPSPPLPPSLLSLQARLCAAQILRSILAARPQQVSLRGHTEHPLGWAADLPFCAKVFCPLYDMYCLRNSAYCPSSWQALQRQGGYALRAIRKFMAARSGLQVPCLAHCLSASYCPIYGVLH